MARGIIATASMVVIMLTRVVMATTASITRRIMDVMATTVTLITDVMVIMATGSMDIVDITATPITVALITGIMDPTGITVTLSTDIPDSAATAIIATANMVTAITRIMAVQLLVSPASTDLITTARTGTVVVRTGMAGRKAIACIVADRAMTARPIRESIIAARAAIN
jgi:hypothetical protein